MHLKRAVQNLTDVACPSCGAASSNVWGTRNAHDILQCGRCEMLFFKRPIESRYDYQEYYPYLTTFDENRFEREAALRRRKFRSQLAAIRRFVPMATTILDVGAGPGYFCRVAIEEGWKALAVEPSEAARAVGQTRFKITYVDLGVVPDGSIDVISCQHVLEHIELPQMFLDSLRRKLRIGGLLVIHVPNQEPLSFYLRNLLTRGVRKSYSAMYYPVHINGFKTKSLKQTVERQKFESIAIFNVSMWSSYYDPFFLTDYFHSKQSLIVACAAVLKHATRCAVDMLGNGFDRGDWIIGYFRAVERS